MAKLPYDLHTIQSLGESGRCLAAVAKPDYRFRGSRVIE
jgi:hypothetical protein